MWVNGTIRKWVVNKLVNATNPDGTQALDDNDLKNYSGKVVTQLTPNNKLSVGYFWNDKIRGHRRDSNDLIPGHRLGRADQPGADDAGRSTPASRTAWCSSRTSASWTARPTTPTSPTPIRACVRIIDTGTTEVFNASTREEHQPNSRHQFDNVFTLRQERHGRRAPVQGRRAVGPSLLRLRLLGAGRSLAGLQQRRADARCASYNSPAFSKNVATVTGFFIQDCLVDEPPDAQPRRPLRQVRRHAAGAVEPGRHVRRPRTRAGAGSDQPEHRACGARRVLRPDRAPAAPHSRPATAVTACRSGSIASPTSTR